MEWKGNTESNWNASVLQNLISKRAYVFNKATANLKLKNVLLGFSTVHYLIFTYKVIPSHNDIKSEVYWFISLNPVK